MSWHRHQLGHALCCCGHLARTPSPLAWPRFSRTDRPPSAYASFCCLLAPGSHTIGPVEPWCAQVARTPGPNQGSCLVLLREAGWHTIGTSRALVRPGGSTSIGSCLVFVREVGSHTIGGWLAHDRNQSSLGAPRWLDNHRFMPCVPAGGWLAHHRNQSSLGAPRLLDNHRLMPSAAAGGLLEHHRQVAHTPSASVTRSPSEPVWPWFAQVPRQPSAYASCFCSLAPG